MTTRMQQRRGTSTQWTSADPILANGEIGVETDTNQFKLGDGVNTWSDLSYFKNLDDLAGSLDDYVLLSTKGQANGVAELDSTGQVPLSQLGKLIDSAPSALNTLNELASALGNDANFSTTILAAVGTKVSSSTFIAHTDATTSVHGIANTALLATTTNVATAKSEAITAAATDATTKANAAQTAAASDATTKAATAKSEAITAAETDATTKANAAQTAAATDATTKASAAQAAAATDATTKVATAKSEAITAAASAADTKVSTHSSATTNVHGISDTSALALTATVNSGLALKANLAGPTFTGTVSGITKSMVGLGSVDNTADADKPVSSAATTALALKAPLASPALTGVPTAPTAAASTNTTQVATTAYVRGEVAALVNSAGATLDTLGEIATALGNDANLSTTLTNAIALKAPLASPTFTGTNTVANITVSGTSNMSANGVQFSDGTQTKVGVPSITTFGSSFAATATLAAGEQDKFVPVAGTVVITLPASGYSTGQSIDFYQASGTGASFAATNSVVGTPGLKFRTTNSVVTAMKTAAGWLVFGDLSA